MLAAIFLQFAAIVCGRYFNLSPISHHSEWMHKNKAVFSFIAGVGGTLSSLTALYLFWVSAGFVGVFLYFMVGLAAIFAIEKFSGYFPGVFAVAIFLMALGWIMVLLW